MCGKMTPRLPLILATLAVVVLLGVPVAGAEETRTWTDATGKHKIEAQYSGMAGTKVKLTLKSGKKMEIELKQLSENDRKYVESLDSDSPFKASEDGDSPFQPGDNEEDSKEESASNETVAKRYKVDWSDSDTIIVDVSDDPWNATLAEHPGWGGKLKPAPLPARVDIFETVGGLCSHPAAQKLVVSFRTGREDSDSQVRLMICDLKGGRAAKTEAVQALAAPIALSGDGSQVLMRHDKFGFGNQETLELWKLKGKNIQRAAGWYPYEDTKGDVKWAEFVDEDHLVTCSSHGRVAYWDLKKVKPIWHLETSNGAVPCLSGDRKLLGFCSESAYGLLDISEGKVIASAATPNPMKSATVSISPSGKKMVCNSQNQIVVINTTNGEITSNFEVQGIHAIGTSGLISDSAFMFGGHFVIDLDSQLKLWEYFGAEQLATNGNMTFAAIAPVRNTGILLPLELPHKAARDVLEKALTQPDLFVFREGVDVKLDVSGVPGGEQERVRTALTKKLSAMNCSISDNANITLFASVTGPKERTVSYFNSGDYKVQEYFSEVRFVYQKKDAWLNRTTNIPGMMMLKRGESIESVLRKASEKADFGFFDHLVLPKFLQKPMEGANNVGMQTLGRSTITATGLK